MATFKGVITAICPEQSGTSKNGKTWRRIDVVLTYDQSKPEFVKSILFSVMNDNIEKFGFVQGGEYEIEVDFSVREYQGKHYMLAACWKAARLDVATSAPQTQYQQPVQPMAQAQPQQSNDLPF